MSQDNGMDIDDEGVPVNYVHGSSFYTDTDTVMQDPALASLFNTVHRVSAFNPVSAFIPVSASSYRISQESDDRQPLGSDDRQPLGSDEEMTDCDKLGSEPDSGSDSENEVKTQSQSYSSLQLQSLQPFQHSMFQPLQPLMQPLRLLNYPNASFEQQLFTRTNHSIDQIIDYLKKKFVCIKGQKIGIYDMNNIFTPVAYKTPDMVIDFVMSTKSRIHVLVARYSYAGTLEWFEDAMRRLSVRISQRNLQKRIFIVCPEPNMMIFDNDVAHELRALEDSKNEHNKRAQDDIMCWILRQRFGSEPINARSFIVTRDKDLIDGKIDQMLRQATPFELKYVDTQHQIVNAGTIHPNTLRRIP